MSADAAGLTFRQFEEGENEYDGFDELVVHGGGSDMCPTYVHRTPPCQASCPSGHDIRGWLAIARGMDKPADENTPWEQYAFERMTKANPFPAIMGRVCPAPCEDGCNRNEVDDFIGINAVEQYVGDWAIENNLKFTPPEKETGKKVAVVGGGPGGLSSALNLRRQGHTVTLFEEKEQLGGMMRYGIPEYRIPRDVLDAEIQRILDIGVEAKTSTKVGQDISLDQIEEEFDAVFWALGAQKGRMLSIPGSDAKNVVSGVDFLNAFAEGRLKYTTKKMVVIGGGDTSIDVASVARRIGHIQAENEHDCPANVVWGYTAHDVASSARREGSQVTLTSLLPVEQMMAAKHERDDAKREGVDMKGGVMPLKIIQGEDGRAKEILMCECEMDGMTPIPRTGTEFTIECDMVVLAIGQSGDLTGLEKLDNGNGFMNGDANYRIPGQQKHFAGGDILRPHLLTTAVGHASVAASSIDLALAGNELDNRPKVDVHHFSLLEELANRHLEPEEYGHQQVRGTSEGNFAIHNYEDRGSDQVATHEELFLGQFESTPRNKRQEVSITADEVLGNYQERLKGITEEEAKAEGARCMSCGLCFECDNCVIFCPQDAVQRTKKDERAIGRYVFTDYSKCIGCHICKDVCPTGYIKMGL